MKFPSRTILRAFQVLLVVRVSQIEKRWFRGSTLENKMRT